VIDDDEVIDAVRADERPVTGTADVADRLGMSTQGASKRLRELASEGRIATDTIGQSRIWWVPEEGREG
jgi:predicted transcriptional regulator